MLIVNLFGAPGSGKSTGAAYIFSQLKQQKISSEIIGEAAKDLIYQNRENVLKENQVLVLGLQIQKLLDLKNKNIDVAISDSPILLQSMYYKSENSFDNEDLLTRLTGNISENLEYNQLSIFINRVKEYSSIGRIHTEIQSDSIADKLINEYDYDLIINGDNEGYDIAVDLIKKQLR